MDGTPEPVGTAAGNRVDTTAPCTSEEDFDGFATAEAGLAVRVFDARGSSGGGAWPADARCDMLLERISVPSGTPLDSALDVAAGRGGDNGPFARIFSTLGFTGLNALECLGNAKTMSQGINIYETPAKKNPKKVPKYNTLFMMHMPIH